MIIIKNFLINLSRRNKVLFLLLIDFLSAFLALYISIGIITKQLFISIFDYPVIIFISLFLFIPIFYSVGLYKSIIRYLGFDFILKSFFAVFLYGVIFYFLNYFILFFYENLIITILQSLIFYVLIIYSRVLLVIIYKELLSLDKKTKVIIYGAGEAGYSLSQRSNNNFNICCFIDDDTNKIQNKINNISIFNPDKLEILIKRFNPEFIIIAIPSLGLLKRKEIIGKCEKFNLKIKIVPQLNDLIIDNINLDKFQFITSDLINRDIKWNQLKISKFLSKKVILVTGAGGSIGSELSKQLLNYNIKKIVIFDNNEFNLFKISNEISSLINLKKQLQTIEVQFILGDIFDLSKLNKIFSKYTPNIVFHSAAYKHVSILENNKYEAVKNNIIGTYYLMQNAIKYKVENFIYISTDKAIKPSSIMGASKRISEMLLTNSFDKNRSPISKFSIVRFGNVINSKGSVIPLFNQQIKNGGPITVTDPAVTRYFMSIPEAVGLVLEASSMSKDGDKFILNMGKKIKILDIAKKMISLAGYKNKLDDKNGEIDIEFIGLRPGEKLHEDLTLSEHFVNTENKYIFKDDYKEKHISDYKKFIDELQNILDNEDENMINSFFRKYIKDCIL